VQRRLLHSGGWRQDAIRSPEREMAGPHGTAATEVCARAD